MAGQKVVCTAVVERQGVDGEEVDNRCGGGVVTRSGCRVCTTCERGARVAKAVAAVGEAEQSKLDKMLKRNAEALQKASHTWSSASADQDHTPAWTKRRRL